VTEPIVVGVDGSDRSLQAPLWAAQAAALHRCQLRIVHTLPRHEFDVPFVPPARWEAVRERGRNILAEAEATAHEAYPGLDVTSGLPSGEAPAKVFLDESGRARAVVLGARGAVGFGNLMLGSVSLQVVGHAACPVIVVDHVTIGRGRVVVGADG
jgi:nucleotide-binding universal stress UspA family protein